MARQMVMIKTTTGFIPLDAISADQYRLIKTGKPVTVSVTQTRNLKFHRKMFALLQVVYDAQPEPQAFLTVEDLLDALKVAVGHSKKMRQFDQNIVIPKSIAFDKMDQANFEDSYERVVEVILKHILPNTTRIDLDKQVFSILDGRNYDA